MQLGLAVTKKLEKPYNLLQLLLVQLVAMTLYYKTIIPLAFVVYGLSALIIYMKKFLHFDWLRAVQFLGNICSAKKRNSVPKKEIQCKFL